MKLRWEQRPLVILINLLPIILKSSKLSISRFAIPIASQLSLMRHVRPALAIKFSQRYGCHTYFSSDKCFFEGCRLTVAKAVKHETIAGFSCHTVINVGELPCTFVSTVAQPAEGSHYSEAPSNHSGELVILSSSGYIGNSQLTPFDR